MNTLAIKKNELLLALLFFLLLASYLIIVWPALSGPFVFDDFPNLQNLQNLELGLSWQTLGHYIASFTDSPGRPISALSFLINDYAWPSNPFSFKYTNVLIHLLNGVLLFGLLRQLAKACSELPQNIFWPLLATAAWLAHPLQLSAQMLVVQRMTLLSAMFCFSGLWAYCALLQRSSNWRGAFAALAALGTATILAFLCKESGSLLPLYAWVMNATLLYKMLETKPKSVKNLVFFSCAIPVLLLIVSIFYTAFQPNAFASREFNMLERALTQIHVLIDYLKQIFIPRLSNSGIYFDDYPITKSLYNPISTLLYCVAILSSIIYAIIVRKHFVILSFAILWFFAGHILESSIIPLELYFEHRNYLPLLGPVVMISTGPFLISKRKPLAFGLFFIWLLLLSLVTGLQAPIWGDQNLMTTIWTMDKPNSLRATQERAKYQYDSDQSQQAADTLLKNYDRGLQYADLPISTLLIKCWKPDTYINRALYRESLHAAAISPYSNSVLSSLLLLRQATQDNICPQTITTKQWLQLTDILLANPKFRLNSESNIRVERAKLFIFQRDLDNAMIELESAYKATPTVELSQKAAEVLISAGLNDEAAQWLENGLKLKQPFFDALMYDPKDYSRNLLKAIDKAKQKQPDTVIHKTK